MPEETSTLTIKIQYGGFTLAEEFVPDDPKAAADTVRAIASFVFKKLRELSRGPEDRD